jgi:hypothetical protein
LPCPPHSQLQVTAIPCALLLSSPTCGRICTSAKKKKQFGHFPGVQGYITTGVWRPATLSTSTAKAAKAGIGSQACPCRDTAQECWPLLLPSAPGILSLSSLVLDLTLRVSVPLLCHHLSICLSSPWDCKPTRQRPCPHCHPWVLHRGYSINTAAVISRGQA